MERVNAEPLPSLCCELNPLMGKSGKRIYYEGDPDTYLELVPMKCRYCHQQVCEDCWESGKHFIKTVDTDNENPFKVKIGREMPQCINGWKNMLLKVKGKL